MSQHLSLGEFAISDSSVSAAVRVSPQNLRVSDDLATAILALRPTLAEHSCKHQGFGYFGDKLVGTTLPHLVEHLAIDFIVEENRKKPEGDTAPATGASQHSHDTTPKAVAGITRWLDRGQGKMQVRISCAAQSTDETCRAITRAIDVLNSLLER